MQGRTIFAEDSKGNNDFNLEEGDRADLPQRTGCVTHSTKYDAAVGRVPPWVETTDHDHPSWQERWMAELCDAQRTAPRSRMGKARGAHSSICSTRRLQGIDPLLPSFPSVREG